MRIGSSMQVGADFSPSRAVPAAPPPVNPPEQAPAPWTVRPQAPATPAAAPAPPRPGVAKVQIANLVIEMERVARVAPVVLFHPDEPYLPCSVEYLLAQATLLDKDGSPLKHNPGQEDLAAHRADGARLVINPSQYTGEALADGKRVQAPMYVSAQVGPGATYVDLHYIFLFAYNGPQTCRVRVPRSSFECVLPNFAEHEGDIEGVTVRVTPDLSRILQVQVEGHGQPTCIAPNDLEMQGTHPVIRCAYNSHATYNAKNRQPTETVVNLTYAGLGFGAEFIDIIADNGARWAPFDVDAKGDSHSNGQLVFVGLDDNGRAVGNQPWATFRGKLGAQWTNTYKGAQGTGKNRLKPMQRAYADTIAKAAVALGATKARAHSDGTDGLGVRSFIHAYSSEAVPKDV